MSIIREGSGAHIGRPALGRLGDGAAHIRIGRDEARVRRRRQTDQIVDHQHLAVAVFAAADADRGRTRTRG